MPDLTNNTTQGTGAQPVPGGTTEVHGVNDITRVISAAFVDFDKADSVRKLARADANTATDAAIGAREKLLRSVASVAHRASWSEDDTTEAAKKAIEQHAGNDKARKSSLSTFASEIKLACHKRVRGRVNEMFDLAREAFEAETLSDDDAPKPIHKAFSRAYHTAQAMMRYVKEGNILPNDVTEFAQATLDAKRVNTKRVKARLDAIRKELQSFTADFGAADGLAECIEFLGEITEGELKAAYERKVGAVDEPETPEEVEGEAPPANISDMLDDALRDMQAAA